MSNIIEKLGIKPTMVYFAGQLNPGTPICLDKDVRELEQQRNELLGALIDVTFEQSKILESINVTLMDDIVAKHIHRIEIIEKATGKSWEEVKKIKND